MSSRPSKITGEDFTIEIEDDGVGTLRLRPLTQRAKAWCDENGGCDDDGYMTIDHMNRENAWAFKAAEIALNRARKQKS
jgi:hypothetical protein